jgi:hypothetical protein
MKPLKPHCLHNDMVNSRLTKLKRIFGVSWLLGSLVLSCSAIASDCPGTPKQSPSSQDWQRWVVGLKGYLVEQGNASLFDTIACKKFEEVFGTCFGANPAAPFIQLQPPVRGSYVDPFFAAPFNSTGPTGVQTNLFFRLTDNDALITLVKLPPQAAYLGYQSYLFTRRTNLYANSSAGQLTTVRQPTQFATPDQPSQLVSPDPGRFEIDASLGNALNNVIVKNQSGAAWNGATVAYVTTSNRAIAKFILDNAPDKCFVFVEPIGSNIITGAGAKADDFLTQIRYAIPQNQQAATDWLNKLNENVLVYKVTNPRVPVNRFGPPSYSVRTASNETALRQPLTELTSLLQGWLASKSSKPVHVGELADFYRVSPQGELDGFIGTKCIANGTNCDADNQDSAVRYGALSSLRSSQTAIVAGVNHTVTDNASYLSVGITYAPSGNFELTKQNGAASSSQTNESAVGFNFGTLTGSAKKVLIKLGLYSHASRQLQRALGFLYVSFVSRNCQKDVPDVAVHCIDLDETIIPEDAVISIAERNYIKPRTTTGPNGSVLVNTKVIYNQ